MDLRLSVTDAGADLVLEGGDLATDRGLRTAVLASVFSDRRAEPEELESRDENPRGFWGEDVADPWGSKLWQFFPGKLTNAALNDARESVWQSLQWMVRQGLAESVDVEFERIGNERALLRLSLVRGSATRGADLWAALVEETLDLPDLTLRILPVL